MVFLRIFRSPPHAKTALVIINIAEFVEAVADLVGHAGARGAVVGRGVTLVIKIGWLQDSRGEGFRIRGEHDNRPDDLRINAPLTGVGWAFQLGQVVRTIKRFRAAHVAEGIAANYLEGRIVDPRVRITDADFE